MHRKKRYQDPKILKTKGRKPYYYIRVRKVVSVSPLESQTVYRQVREYLCPISESINKAKERKTAILSSINTDSAVLGNITVREFAEIYKRDHGRQVAESTQYNLKFAIDGYIISHLGDYKL